MKKILPILLITSFLLGDTKTVAISYFDNTSGLEEYNSLSKGLADMLITDLSNVESIQIVEREKLESLLNEIKLGESKFFDPATVQKLGKGLGADIILTGAFLSIEPDMRIDARLIDVETGKIIKANKVMGKSSDFFLLESQLVDQLIANLDIKLSKKPPKPKQEIKLDAVVDYSKSIDLLDKGFDEEARKILESTVEENPGFTYANKFLMKIRKTRKSMHDAFQTELRESIRDNIITINESLETSHYYKLKQSEKKRINALKIYGLPIDVTNTPQYVKVITYIKEQYPYLYQENRFLLPFGSWQEINIGFVYYILINGRTDYFDKIHNTIYGYHSLSDSIPTLLHMPVSFYIMFKANYDEFEKIRIDDDEQVEIEENILSCLDENGFAVMTGQTNGYPYFDKYADLTKYLIDISADFEEVKDKMIELYSSCGKKYGISFIEVSQIISSMYILNKKDLKYLDYMRKKNIMELSSLNDAQKKSLYKGMGQAFNKDYFIFLPTKVISLSKYLLLEDYFKITQELNVDFFELIHLLQFENVILANELSFEHLRKSHENQLVLTELLAEHLLSILDYNEGNVSGFVDRRLTIINTLKSMGSCEKTFTYNFSSQLLSSDSYKLEKLLELEYFVLSNFGPYNFNFISEIKILVDQIYSEKSYYQYTENLLSDLESCFVDANAGIDDIDLLFYLGEKYGQIGKYKKAVALLMQGFELSPDIQGFEYYASLIKQYSKHY